MEFIPQNFVLRSIGLGLGWILIYRSVYYRLSLSSYHVPGFVQRHDEEQTYNKHWRPRRNIIQMAARSSTFMFIPDFEKWRNADQWQTNHVDASRGSGAFVSKTNQVSLPNRANVFQNSRTVLGFLRVYPAGQSPGKPMMSAWYRFIVI